MYIFKVNGKGDRTNYLSFFNIKIRRTSVLCPRRIQTLIKNYYVKCTCKTTGKFYEELVANTLLSLFFVLRKKLVTRGNERNNNRICNFRIVLYALCVWEFMRRLRKFECIIGNKITFVLSKLFR